MIEKGKINISKDHLYMGIDFGDKKIGFAIGQFITTKSTPIKIVSNYKNQVNWAEIQEIISENQPLKKVRDINEKVEAAKGNDELFKNFRKSIERKTRGFLAPEYNIQCIEAAVNKPFNEGKDIETKLFMELITGNQSAAQRYVFFAQRQVAKIPDIEPDTEIKPFASVGVIGAGTMGGGISMNFANVGIPVTIIEQSQENLDKGLGII